MYTQEAVEAVRMLNIFLFEALENKEPDQNFEYATDGNTEIIYYGDVELFNDECDDEEFDNSNQNMYDFILERFDKYFNNLALVAQKVAIEVKAKKVSDKF